MELVVSVCVGFAVGAAVVLLHMKTAKFDGTLQIDLNNPKKDIYRLYINNLDIFSSKKSIRLRVDHDVDLSQK